MKPIAKIGIITAVAMAVVVTVVLKEGNGSSAEPAASEPEANPGPAVAAATGRATEPATDTETESSARTSRQERLPRLVDLGADKCIPCKLMAPILEELKDEYAGRMEVEFIDVWKNPEAGKRYGVEMIPTQVFFDPDGKERFRHVGFYGKEDILAKWVELGVDLKGDETADLIVRETPAQADTRSTGQVCFLCDGDVNPKTRTVVKGQTDQRTLCSPHCYFIYYSSIVGADPRTERTKVSVTDSTTGDLVSGASATYLYGMDDRGRPMIEAFADREQATAKQRIAAGNILGWEVLSSKELATRCGFCDRAVYPEDASKVTVDGTTRTYGCCTHCAMGVAARFGKDIEVEACDGLTGEPIRVTTLNGMVASLEPSTAVAWFGQKKNPEGKWVSAGCFKQGFFATRANLKKWLDAHPRMTGRQITIAKALADKMKLTPEQIAKACKLGECQ